MLLMGYPLLIDLMNNFNNRKIIFNEKSTILQVSEKSDITCDSLHELIRNGPW
ncbi:MAG: hypothetical protein ACTS73_05920 [Arsenophonus sp. NEOnobi-MAG3]